MGGRRHDLRLEGHHLRRGDPFTEEGSDCYPGGYFQAKVDETVTPAKTHYAIEYSDLDDDCGSFNPDDNWPGVQHYRKVTTTATDTHVEIETYKIDPDTHACVTSIECTPLEISTTESLDDPAPDEEVIDPEPTEEEKCYLEYGPPYYWAFTSWGTYTKTWDICTYDKISTKTYGAPDAIESETEPEAPSVGDVWKKTSTGVYYECTAVTEASPGDPEADPPVEEVLASATWELYDTCKITDGCGGSMSYGYTAVTTTNTEWGTISPTASMQEDYGVPAGGNHFTTTVVVSVSGSWSWVPEVVAVDAVEADPEADPPVEAVEGVDGVPAHCRFQGSVSVTTTSDDPGVDTEMETYSYAIDTDYVLPPDPDPMPDPPPDPPAFVSTIEPSLPEGFTTITTVDPAPIPEELITYSDPITPVTLWADPVTGKERGFWIDEEGYGTPDDVTYGVYTHFGYDCHSLHLNGMILNVNDDIVGGYYGKRRTYYRWKIPTSYTGNKVKITWDVLTEPALQAKSLVKDLTWEFAGPGTGDYTNSSWYSPTFILEPPDVTGRKEIVNIRFTGTPSNPHGTKPQVTGRAIELPDPPPP